MNAVYNALYECICFDLLGVESMGPSILKCYSTWLGHTPTLYCTTASPLLYLYLQ